jgi:hypothetical protein
LFIVTDILLGVLALISIGYAVGRLLPNPIVSPAITFLLFSLSQTLHLLPYFFPQWVPSGMGNLSPFAGYFSWDLTPFYTMDRELLFSHGGWLFSLIGLALGVIVLKKDKAIGSWVWIPGFTLLAIGFAVKLLFFTPNQQPLNSTVPESVCATHAISICVHPAYAPTLEDVSHVIGNIITPVRGTSGAPTRAIQHPPVQNDGTPLPNGALVLKDGTLVFSLVNYVNSELNGSDYLAWVVAWAVVQEQTEVGAQTMTVPQAIVATWLVQKAGYSLIQPYSVTDLTTFTEQYTQFSKADVSTQTQWIHRNFAAIRAGATVPFSEQ